MSNRTATKKIEIAADGIPPRNITDSDKNIADLNSLLTFLEKRYR